MPPFGLQMPPRPFREKQHSVTVFKESAKKSNCCAVNQPKSRRGAIKSWLQKRGGTVSYPGAAPHSLQASEGQIVFFGTPLFKTTSLLTAEGARGNGGIVFFIAALIF